MLRSPTAYGVTNGNADRLEMARGPVVVPLPPAHPNGVFTGTASDDVIHGTSGDDVFKMFQSGHDTVYGGGGNDEFHFGHYFGVNDVVRGGAGFDSLYLSGSVYAPPASLTITPGMMQGVEYLFLNSDNDFRLTFAPGVIGTDDFLRVVSSSERGHQTYIEASQLTKSFEVFAGGADDFVDGGSGDDMFLSDDISNHGGTDDVALGAGNDFFVLNGDLTADDLIAGGTDFDTVSLNGDYSAGLVLGPNTLSNVETVTMGGAFDYNITIPNIGVIVGETFVWDAHFVTGGHSLTFDGSVLDQSPLAITGTSGNDHITAGKLGDTIDLSGGGTDAASGGDGDDTFEFGSIGSFGTTDKLDGGAGVDDVYLFGNGNTLTITGVMMKAIERLTCNEDADFTLTMKDTVVAAGASLAIGGGNIGATHALVVNASAETDGFYTLYGGHGNDTLTGGDNADNIRGAEGADTLKGRGGADSYEYLNGAADSTSTHFDTIIRFDANAELFVGLDAVSGVDHKITSGLLSTATFDANLAAGVNAATLAAHHAVLFEPDSGDFAGDIFLVIDVNGTAGYQASQDLVIDLEGPAHINQLSLVNFGH